MSNEEKFMIAAPQTVASKLAAIFEKAQLPPAGICYSGEDAATAAGEEGALFVATWKLDDMTGAELAARLGAASDVLMIVPQDYESDGGEGENVMLLHNPISPEALAHSVRVLAYCRGRMGALRAREQKLERMLEERKIIDRAKGRLMDSLNLREAEAHHLIQKRSMDRGMRIADVAREILEAEDLSAL